MNYLESWRKNQRITVNLQGPLGISNIGLTHVSLAWRPPVDDGGSKITSYIVEKRDVLKDEWTVVASTGEIY